MDSEPVSVKHWVCEVGIHWWDSSPLQHLEFSYRGRKCSSKNIMWGKNTVYYKFRQSFPLKIVYIMKVCETWECFLPSGQARVFSLCRLYILSSRIKPLCYCNPSQSVYCWDPYYNNINMINMITETTLMPSATLLTFWKWSNILTFFLSYCLVGGSLILFFLFLSSFVCV